ncbi:MAG TPA: serine hydrolase [Terriglobales bacterium]|nr:serine hydrolase [Terriglobales bacterium]
MRPFRKLSKFRSFSIRLLLSQILLVLSCPLLAQQPSLAAVDEILEKAIAEQKPPGAVVLIGHDHSVIYRKAFGFRSLEPTREPMTADTIFDVASLTKCMVTATASMQLLEKGQIRLNDPVTRYIPEFGMNGKQDITVRQLLTHFSGLAEDLDLKQHWEGYDTAVRMAMEETPVYPPGSRFLYSDINYIVLGEIVRRVSGFSLDAYATTNIFKPLGLEHTDFTPPAAWRPIIAATEYDERGVMLRGVVHDPTARRMGGVAGHAGLFSTADDVARYAQALLDGGAPILSALSVEKMSTPQQPPTASSLRGLGWDIDSPFSTTRGEFLPVGSFGHTGFTGTSLWIDPSTNTYIIILANSVHPRGQNSIVSLRSRVATAVATALKLTPSESEQVRLRQITGYNETLSAAHRVMFRNGMVKTGIDVLESHNFQELQSKDSHKTRIGLVTNQTGVDSSGRRTIDVLAHAPGVELVAIFSPEHGVTGGLDTAQIGNTRDSATGITVYSVYGDSDAKRRPDPAVLKNLDAVIYDIQDVGVRFYTYETTLGYFLEGVAKAGIDLIVLDRPNPITGAFVQGPISTLQRGAFVDYHPLPVRHGMTVGELAKLFNSERSIGARLRIVPMNGWMRGDWFDSTGLSWVNLSPNMRSLTEATLYPGVGLVEGTNISVGRGTGTPFEVVGAPWIKPTELAAYLNGRMIQGVRFVPVSFTPISSNYANQLCGGVNIVVVDRNFFDPTELGIELASALRKLYPSQFQLDRMIELLGNQSAFNALLANEDPRIITEGWRDELDEFVKLKKKYLIY